MSINKIQSLLQSLSHKISLATLLIFMIQRFPLKQGITGSEDLGYKDMHMVGV